MEITHLPSDSETVHTQPHGNGRRQLSLPLSAVMMSCVLKAEGQAPSFHLSRGFRARHGRYVYIVNTAH